MSSKPRFALKFLRGSAEVIRITATVLCLAARKMVALTTRSPVNKEGYHTLSLNQDGKWTPLLDWKQDPAVKVGYGPTNRMAVEVQGRTIRVYVNDKQVGLVQGPQT